MLGKFEKKVINLKNKINKKVLSIIIFAIFGAFIIFSLNMTNSYKRQKQITATITNSWITTNSAVTMYVNSPAVLTGVKTD